MDDLAQPEARVVVNGEPVEGGDPLFVGSLEEAQSFVQSLPPEQREEVSIFTPDRVYSSKDI